MLYKYSDHTNVSLYYLGVTKNKQQEIDAHFDQDKIITFHGIGITDFMLHILSCVKMFNNTRKRTWPMCNGDLVQYHEMRNLRNIYNISSNYQIDEFQLPSNDLKQISKIKEMTLYEKLILRSGVMISIFNEIKKVNMYKK